MQNVYQKSQTLNGKLKTLQHKVSPLLKLKLLQIVIKEIPSTENQDTLFWHGQGFNGFGIGYIIRSSEYQKRIIRPDNG